MRCLCLLCCCFPVLCCCLFCLLVALPDVVCCCCCCCVACECVLLLLLSVMLYVAFPVLFAWFVIVFVCGLFECVFGLRGLFVVLLVFVL